METAAVSGQIEDLAIQRRAAERGIARTDLHAHADIRIRPGFFYTDPRRVKRYVPVVMEKKNTPTGKPRLTGKFPARIPQWREAITRPRCVRPSPCSAHVHAPPVRHVPQGFHPILETQLRQNSERGPRSAPIGTPAPEHR